MHNPMSGLSSIIKGKTGSGVLFGIILLATVEAWLHTDHFLYQYRSVFAAGRAMDKIQFIEYQRPRLLLAGNSRIDNGFDPQVMGALMGMDAGEIFNLGIPGANAGVIFGMMKRLERGGLFSDDQLQAVVLGVDESFFAAEDSLGYLVYFGDQKAMWSLDSIPIWFGSILRLWGYSDNLKQLREPEKLLRFLKANVISIEPVGGAAHEFFGYRAGFSGRFQNAAQVRRQVTTFTKRPSTSQKIYFRKIIDLCHEHNVELAIVLPPLLDRQMLFEDKQNKHAAPYLMIKQQLEKQKTPILSMDNVAVKDPMEFANAGHLNDKGAKRFSKLLAQQLLELWPDLVLVNYANATHQ